MELVTSLASTAVLGIGSMIAFNIPIKTLMDRCMMAPGVYVTVGLALQTGHL